MGHPAKSQQATADRVAPRVARTPALAEVIVLDEHRPAPDRSVYLRRRVLVALAVTALLAVVTVGLGRIAATAAPDTATGGHVVVEPGQTLWQVAVEHAPADTDPRAYLDRIVQVNGFDGAAVDAWEVVLLPAD